MAGSLAVGLAVPPITYAAMDRRAARPSAEEGTAAPEAAFGDRPKLEEASRSMQRPPLSKDEVYDLKRLQDRRQRARIQAAEAAAAALAAKRSAAQNGVVWYGLDSHWAAMGPAQRYNAALAFRLIEGKPWFTTEQARCLDELWWQESEFKTSNPNPASEADGIPQANPASKMASAGPDWRTNPRTQELWGIGYIEERYGTPCDAEAHERDQGYY